MKTPLSNPFCILGFLSPLLFISCAPTVNLSTPDPVKIDVNMNVHVTTDEVKKSIDGGKEGYSPRQERRARMAEVQTLKNNRIIGEGNEGLLVLKEPPVDPAYQSYVTRVIKEENADRQMVLNDEAETKKQPVSVVAKDFARRNRDAAFPGEWVQQEDGSWIKR